MVTITGGTKKREMGRIGNAQCADLLVLMCLFGLAAKLDFMWMLGLQLMPSAHVDMCVQKRQLPIGPKSLFLMVPILFMLPVHSAHISFLVNKATSDLFSKDLLTNTRVLPKDCIKFKRISYKILISNELSS